MIGEAGARDLPFINAHIESIRFHRESQGLERELRLCHQLGESLSGKLLDCAHVLKGDNHEVAVVVRVAVQHHVAVLPAVKDMILFIAVLCWLSAKNALLGLWCFGRNESHAPGGP